MSTAKEMVKLRRELQRAGWRVEHKRKHYKCYHPSGRGYVAMSVTPSDPNAHLAAKREIEKLERTIQCTSAPSATC